MQTLLSVIASSVPLKCFLRLLAMLAVVFEVTAATAATLRMVTSFSDGGPGSLRQAIADSASGDSIQFSGAGTVVLTNGELLIDKDLSIAGLAGNQLIIDGNNQSRVFNIAGGTVQLNGLTITRGFVEGASTFFGAPGPGGGLYNAGTLSLTDCIVSNNLAKGGALVSTEGSGGRGQGGGLYNADSGVAFLKNCTFTRNRAVGGEGLSPLCMGMCIGGSAEGGGMRTSGSITVVNCTFEGNRAEGATGNSSGSGAGAGIYSALDQLPPSRRMVVINCTLSNNLAVGRHPAGGGFASPNYSPPGSNCFWNSVIAGNAASFSGPDVSGLVTSWGHNFIASTNDSSGWVPNDLAGTKANPLNPRLSPLTDNGGPTPTMAPLSSSGGGGVVDAGDDAVMASPWNIQKDQRGQPRRFGTHVDIGSVEWAPAAFAPTLIASRGPNPGLQFQFTHTNGTMFTVLSATNVSVASSNWTALGSPISAGGSVYQFRDTNTPIAPARFYELRWP